MSTGSSSSPSPLRTLVQRLFIPLVAMIIAFVAGWINGSGHASSGSWTDATVTGTGATSATVVVGSDTYTIATSVPAWVDTHGTWKSSGWPACLTDSFSGTVPVLVSSTSADRHTVSVLVAVDCRKQK